MLDNYHILIQYTITDSKAIKCATVAQLLASGKKVQKVLIQWGVFECFFTDKKLESMFSANIRVESQFREHVGFGCQ